MQWPSWAFWRREGTPDKSANDDKQYERPASTSSLDLSLNRLDISDYINPQTLAGSVFLTATILGLNRFYKSYVRRVPSVGHLKPGVFRQRSIYGLVTRVGDGDNFHLFHTPGGRLMGWGWIPGRRAEDLLERGAKPSDGQTISIRIAGVDAPEMSHFGKPEQPYAKEALDWLRDFLLGRYVRVYPYRQDQYQRVVGTAYTWRWLVWKRDVGLAMLKRGLATVYEAKNYSEFGNMEDKYRAAEERAKRRKLGMWQDASVLGRLLGGQKEVESPRAYKTRMAQEEKKRKP